MTTTGAPLLEIRALHLWRGDRHLLRNVNFSLFAGQLLQLVGPNGVGKTSLLRAACGLLPIESGDIVWRGQLIDSARDAYHRELAYLGHSNALKADLTATENLAFSLSLKRTVARDEIHHRLKELAVEHCAALPARVLSAGQKRRTALAGVLLSQAVVWILDEPTTNLDTAGIARLEALMRTHLDSGGAILTAAHHALLADDARASTLELAA